MRRLLPCAFVAVLSSSACVHLTIKKADALSEKGLHFSRPAAYLWITVNDKGQCIPSITYLPDPQQDYVMRVWPWGFGTVSFKPTLKDGWNLTALAGCGKTRDRVDRGMTLC